jgi:3-oxoacyl-[acyl-carrier protein] reductase
LLSAAFCVYHRVLDFLIVHQILQVISSCAALSWLKGGLHWRRCKAIGFRNSQSFFTVPDLFQDTIMSKLAGKVAVVTGASKGIGAAIAKALAAEGASVVVNYASSKAGADAVVAAITAAQGKAVAVGGDVSKAADVKGIINAAVETFGRLDILVNNSGIYEFSPIEEITEEHFHKQFNTNVLGVLLTTQAAVGHLGEGGSIINVSSVVSRITPPASAVYSGTKGAVDAITGVLARELGPRKIRVNSINPGVVVTEGTHSAGIIGSDLDAWALTQTPLGRLGQPDDIASIAVFLASDDARWMTGEHLVASGGMR